MLAARAGVPDAAWRAPAAGALATAAAGAAGVATGARAARLHGRPRRQRAHVRVLVREGRRVRVAVRQRLCLLPQLRPLRPSGRPVHAAAVAAAARAR